MDLTNCIISNAGSVHALILNYPYEAGHLDLKLGLFAEPVVVYEKSFYSFFCHGSFRSEDRTKILIS